jgi:hypothetical protein
MRLLWVDGLNLEERTLVKSRDGHGIDSRQSCRLPLVFTSHLTCIAVNRGMLIAMARAGGMHDKVLCHL